MSFRSLTYLLLLPLLLFCQNSLAQGQNNFWYFGDQFGLDFNSNPPTLLYDGQLQSEENAAAVSTLDGELLFYTNGEQLWNRNHLPMQNGQGLSGHFSAQAGIAIVPFVDNPDRFYLFTASAIEQDPEQELRFSVVDMDLDGGLGAVAPGLKNILLDSGGFQETVYAVHSNCDTTWVLGVLQGSPDRLYAYLIDEDGLHDPVQSELGHRYFLYAESGADLIVLADFSEFGLYTFDPESGEIDFLYSLPVAAPFNPVRAHLSPDRSKLYVVEGTPATTYTLYQYDLAAGGQPEVLQSKTELATFPVIPRDVQLAPDGKIYLAPQYIPPGDYLSIIHQPDLPGLACDFEKEAILFDGPFPSYGCFPNPVVYPNSAPPLEMRDTFLCQGDSLWLSATDRYDSYLWSDGSTDSLLLVTAPGTYWVRVSYGSCVRSDTVEVLGWILDQALLPPDTVVCEGELLELDIFDPQATSYLWSTGYTGSLETLSEDGYYWAEVSDGYCNYRDFIAVEWQLFPFALGPDTTLCPGDTLILEATTPFGSYSWQDGSSQPVFVLDSPGTYWVDVEARGCEATDSIEVAFFPDIGLDLGEDGVVCRDDQPLVLSAFHPAALSYLWNTDESGPTIVVEESGLYAVEVWNDHCRFYDERDIALEQCKVCEFYAPTAFSPDFDGINDEWMVFPNCELMDFELFLFDRWGDLVFSADSPTARWDGAFRGQPVQQGVYVYLVRYVVEEFGEIREKVQSGDVTVIR